MVLAVDPAGSRAQLDEAVATLGADPRALLDAERASWSAFQERAGEPDGLSEDERGVYRQALAVLRMAQVREANSAGGRPHGQIVASIPPGKWNIAWVRDMAYAIEALVLPTPPEDGGGEVLEPGAGADSGSGGGGSGDGGCGCSVARQPLWRGVPWLLAMGALFLGFRRRREPRPRRVH